MINFNLLPKQVKQDIAWRISARIFFVSALFAALWFIIVGVLLGAARYYLVIQEEGLRASAQAIQRQEEVREVQELEQEINEVNHALRGLKSARATGGYNTLAVLERIAPYVPQGAYLTQATISADTGTVALEGHASVRSQVVILKEYLEDDTFFSEVKFPLSNISSEENIDFSFILTLSNEALL
ncbi:MAG: PilN domain-containing protein [Candidatus Spechtbacterales bacterium]